MKRGGARSLTEPIALRVQRCREVEILGEDDAAALACGGDDAAIVRTRGEGLVDADDIVTQRAQERDGTRCDVQVGEQPHATAEVRSLASQAPYFAAW